MTGNSHQRRVTDRHWKYRFLTDSDAHSVMGVMLKVEVGDVFGKSNYGYTWTCWAGESDSWWKKPLVFAFKQQQDATMFALQFSGKMIND